MRDDCEADLRSLPPEIRSWIEGLAPLIRKVTLEILREKGPERFVKEIATTRRGAEEAEDLFG